MVTGITYTEGTYPAFKKGGGAIPERVELINPMQQKILEK